MNKFLITISFFSLLLLSYTSSVAQAFTDYKIGEKLEGKDMINMDIAGVSGTLFIYTNNKKIIRSMGFVPSKDGGNTPSEVYKGEFVRFKTFMEQYYQSGFERTIDNNQQKQHYKLKYNGCNVVITIGEFGDTFSTASLVFMINKI
ncbi:hypothetical protein [Flammeovirga sp. EKP202]|uniref:hypothetical protein n=1 Tax=Flammeovirga sp. EKP202 TaxID=2770592 RepID=UPI00165EF298|nr:hypothetical protein [Flammeovirga sp. EKP202]MBD0402763.1 hypothetical protein [Flammeovirga sp. EKP202]